MSEGGQFLLSLDIGCSSKNRSRWSTPARFKHEMIGYAQVSGRFVSWMPRSVAPMIPPLSQMRELRLHSQMCSSSPMAPFTIRGGWSQSAV